MLPDPVRDEFGTRTHGSLADAVHPQPSLAETATENRPPEAPTRVSDRSSVNRQGAASCLIVTRWSLTTTVPVRMLDCWLAAAVTVISDSPWPDDGVT